MEKFEFKKKYGQNFLKDEHILEKIINNVNVEKNDLIIEIGPGQGALTKYLKKLDCQILAYEIDTSLKEYLEKLKDTNINYILDDFLNRDIIKDLKEYSYNKLVLVANLPYYITTPILEKVMKLNIFEEVVIMVQDEVAKRLCAIPKSKDYGAFTVLLGYFYQRKYLFFVNRSSFYPIPNVDSAVIKLTKKEQNELDFDKFKKIVFDSFQFKRKNLKNNLKSYDLNKVQEVLFKYGLSLNNRAEEVSIECFIELYNSLFNSL